MIAALITSAQSDPRFAEVYRARFLEPRRDPARVIFQRAIERGEIPADTDIEVALDLLYGPFYHRVLHGHAQLTDRFTRAIVEHVVTAVAPAAPAVAMSAPAPVLAFTPRPRPARGVVECAESGKRPALAKRRLAGWRPGEHGIEQTREALVEVRSAQAVQAGRALFALIDHAGFAQDAEMVGQRRLGDVQVEGSAAPRRRALGQPLDDPQPLGIAERVQHVGDLQLVAGGVEKGHEFIVRRSSSYMVRCSSY